MGNVRGHARKLLRNVATIDKDRNLLKQALAIELAARCRGETLRQPLLITLLHLGAQRGTPSVAVTSLSSEARRITVSDSPSRARMVLSCSSSGPICSVTLAVNAAESSSPLERFSFCSAAGRRRMS